MQDPCPTFLHRRPCTAPLALLSLLSLLCAAVSAPASASPSITDQAARWLSSQLKVPAERISVQAPDPRWRMPQCAAGLRFDTPFSNANTVRVRCETPQWQVFLRAQWPEEPLPAVATASAAPTAPRAESSPASSTTASRPNAEPRRGIVLTRAVGRGSLLSPASAEATQVPAREADSLLLTDTQFLNQMEAVRDLPAGVPLRQTDIRPAVLVRQGQWVTMTAGQGSGFTITVRLEAMQDGRLGDRVILRNTESGRTVSGVVTGMNAAKGA